MITNVQIAVKRKIVEKDQRCWKSTCLLYTSLALYNDSIKRIQLHPWWVFVRHFPATHKKVSCVFAILCVTQPVGLQRNLFSSICQLCSNSCRETPMHILFKCNALKSLREILLNNIVEAMPRNMSNSFTELNNQDKHNFLISGLHSDTYVHEWCHVYYHTALFVFDMYKKRALLYDNA